MMWRAALRSYFRRGTGEEERRKAPIQSRHAPPNGDDACHVTMSDTGSAATTVPTPDLRRLENATEERETCAVPRGRR